MATPELSLGGLPLLYDHESQVERYLRTYQPLQQTLIEIEESIHEETDRQFSSRGFTTVGLPNPNYPPPPPPRINQLYWPTGASRWARGYFLMDSVNGSLLGASLGQYSGKRTFKAVIDNGTVTTDLYVLHPRQFGSGEGPYSNCWIIPVVDERYWWQFRNVGDITFGSGDIESWQELWEHLETQLGITLSGDKTPNASYLTPDVEEFNRRYDNAALMLDAVAFSLGERIVRDLDGSVTNIDDVGSEFFHWLNTVATRNDEAYAIVTGRTGYFQVLIPEKVEVVFPKSVRKQPDEDREVYVVTVNASTHKLAAQFTVPGSIHTIHSSQWADYDLSTEANPNNKSSLDALGAIIGQDYYEWTKVTRSDVTYAGIKTWALGGQDDGILYSFGIDLPEAPAGVGYYMRVQPFPGNFGVTEQLTNDVAVNRDCCLEIGKLVDSQGDPADLASGDIGFLQIFKQEGTSDPEALPPVTAQNRVKVMNITTITLRAGPIMYRHKVDHCEQDFVFPAEIEECFQPGQTVNTTGM